VAGSRPEQIDDINKAQAEIGKFVPQQNARGQQLVRRYVPAAHENSIRLVPLIGAGPMPNPDPFDAMPDSLLFIELLKMKLLVGNDNIHVVGAPQTMVDDR